MTRLFNKRTLLSIVAINLLFLPNLVLATGYTSLVGLPGLENPNNISLQEYINALLRIAIIVAAIMAVVKLILAGAQYVLTALITEKADAKADIKSALLGLLIIIGAVTILREINPNLVTLPMLPQAPSYYDSYVPPVQIPSVVDCLYSKNDSCKIYSCMNGVECDVALKKCLDTPGYSDHDVVAGAHSAVDRSRILCRTDAGGTTPKSTVNGIVTASHTIDRDLAMNQVKLITDSNQRNIPLVQVEVEGSTSVKSDSIRNDPQLRTVFEDKCKNAGGTKVFYSVYTATKPVTLYPFCYK